MSRYSYETYGEIYSYNVIVGWDAPLQTYFAQVFSFFRSDPCHEEPALWIGATREEITTVEELERSLHIMGYGSFSDELRENLNADKEREPFIERPTPLAALIRLFEENISEE